MKNNEDISFVFISGLGVSPAIAKSFSNCVFLDYPKSQLVSGESSEEKLLSIVSLLNKQAPKNSVLIGWSLGGLMASRLMMLFPEKYRALVTICSTPKFVESPGWFGISEKNIHALRELAKDNLSLFMRRFSGLLLYPHIGRNELKEKLAPCLVERDLIFYFQLLMTLDVRDSFPFCHSDVLHIYGDQDAIVPMSVIGNYPEAQNVHVIKGAGHLPFCTHQDEVLQIIKAFLSDLSWIPAEVYTGEGRYPVESVRSFWSEI